jgi:hypothetical protein
VGLHDVGGVKCHHLSFLQEDIDWQIWIDAKEPHVPRKFAITYAAVRDQPQYVALMDDWNLAPAVTDDLFAFAPSAQMQSVPLADLVAAD